MGIKDIPQGIQVNQRKRIGAIETPKKPVSSGKGTQALPPAKTSALDPGNLGAANRLQAYALPDVDPNLARVREALDKVRAQFPELSDQQWKDYLSMNPQMEVEKNAEKAAETVVKKATPEQQTDAVKTSAKIQGTYTAEEILIYKDLKKKLPPEGQANLKKLLMDGQLLKQDAKNSGNLLHYLNGLSKITFENLNVAEGAKKQSVLEQVVQDIAHPEDIQQRLDVSCLGTAGQYDMAKNKPTEYARVVSELYKSNANPSSSLAALGFKQDDLPFMNLVGLGEAFTQGVEDKKYSKGYLEGALSFVEKRFPNASAGARKLLDNVKKAGQAFFDGRFLEALDIIKQNRGPDVSNAVKEETKRMANSLISDVGIVFQINEGQAGDQLGLYAKDGLFGLQGSYVDDGGKALAAAKDVLNEGKERVYAVLKGEEAGHMVIIKAIEDGKVTFYDPESEEGKSDEQTLDASAFSDSFSAVFLPEGKENGLSPIREDDTTPIWGRGSSGGTRR